MSLLAPIEFTSNRIKKEGKHDNYFDDTVKMHFQYILLCTGTFTHKDYEFHIVDRDTHFFLTF